jgi:hypothetical protein
LALSSTDPGHRNFSYDIVDNIVIRHTFKDLVGYPRILEELRPLRGWHAYKASLKSALPDSFAAMLGDLGLYTSFDQDHDSIFFSLLGIKPAMLPASMHEDYSTSASSMPSCFLRRTDLLGNLFLIMSLLNLLSLPFLFLDDHTGHPARHDARNTL